MQRIGNGKNFSDHISGVADLQTERRIKPFITGAKFLYVNVKPYVEPLHIMFMYHGKTRFP
jgi:hypothetical protein